MTHGLLHPSQCRGAGEDEQQEAPQGQGEEHRQSLCPLSGSTDPSPLALAPSSRAGPSPSPVLRELMSEEVVGCQLDGLLGGNEGQVHGSPCEARGRTQVRGPGWGGSRPALASQLAKPCPVTRWPPPPALSPTSVPGRGGAQAGTGSLSPSGHSACPVLMTLPLLPSGPPRGRKVLAVAGALWADTGGGRCPARCGAEPGEAGKPL